MGSSTISHGEDDASGGKRAEDGDPKHMEWMASQFPKGWFLLCPDGRHLAMYDDHKTYFEDLTGFFRDVEAARIGNR